MKTKTVVLKNPINWAVGGEEKPVKAVELREPTAGDIWDYAPGSKLTVGELMVMASRISEFTPQFYKKLSPEDTWEVCSAVTDFLTGGEDKKDGSEA